MVKLREELVILTRLDDHLTREYKRLGVEGDRFASKTDAAMRRAEQSTGRLGSTLGNVAGRLAGFAAAAGGAIVGAEAARGAKEFSIAMAEVSTIVDTATVSMSDLEAGVLGISAAHGKSATEVAGGLYQVISSGAVDARDSVALLSAAQDLATAGIATTSESVDLITTALNAYGLNVAEAARVSDILFTTVRIGKTTIPELAASLGQVLPIAAALGVPLEDVAALVGSITTKGVRTAEAVTQVRAAMVALLKKSSEVNAIFGRVGQTFDDTTVRTRGLSNVLATLREATGGSEIELVSLLGRVEAANATLNLTGENASSAAAALDAMAASAGATDAALGKVLASSGKRFEIALNKLKLAASGAFGEAILETATGLANGLNDATDAVGEYGSVALQVFTGVRDEVLLVEEALQRVADRQRQLAEEIKPFGQDFTPDPSAPAASAPLVAIGFDGDGLRLFEEANARLRSILEESNEDFLVAFDVSESEKGLRRLEATALDSYDRQLAGIEAVIGAVEERILREGAAQKITAADGNAQLERLAAVKKELIANARAGAAESKARAALASETDSAYTKALLAADRLQSAATDEIKLQLERGLITRENALAEIDNAERLGEVLRRNAKITEERRLRERSRDSNPDPNADIRNRLALTEEDGFSDALTEWRVATDDAERAFSATTSAVFGFQNAMDGAILAALDGESGLRNFGQTMEQVGKQILAQIISQGIAGGVAKLFVPFATGGPVSGPVHSFAGGGGFIDPRDTVPAMLRRGEFVLRPEAVRSIGRDTLDRANRSGSLGGSGGGVSISMPVSVTVAGNADEPERAFGKRVTAAVVRGLRGESRNLISAVRRAQGGR